MAKVIVERPRYGSRARGEGKGYKRACRRVETDEQPKREGMKRATRGGTKSLNEHLGPLRRYLNKQVGRPWNKVFAEICANLSRDSAVQDHVRDHVFDFVAVNVFELDGVLYERTKWGYEFPLHASWRRSLYICPATGLLRRAKKVRRRARAIASPLALVYRDHDTSFVCKADIWYLARFEPFPINRRPDVSQPAVTVADALEGARLRRDEVLARYGRAAYVADARRASREEVRKYCEPLKAPNRV
jgi:hypothetical protein